MELNKDRYTREAMAARAKFSPEKEEADDLPTFKKKFYATFLKSWDAETYGTMTPSRFYAAYSHLKTTADIKAMRELHRWCEAHGVPFAPIAWDKYAMKRTRIDTSKK